LSYTRVSGLLIGHAPNHKFRLCVNRQA